MPELPDIVVYINALRPRLVGQPLNRVHLLSPFVLRSVEPPISSIVGRQVKDLLRVGKRIVLAFEPLSVTVAEETYLVLHLMIAGRLRWRDPGQKVGIGPKLILASLEFPNGTLLFTEASSTKRASMRVVSGLEAVRALDPGGLEPLDATVEA